MFLTQSCFQQSGLPAGRILQSLVAETRRASEAGLVVRRPMFCPREWQDTSRCPAAVDLNPPKSVGVHFGCKDLGFGRHSVDAAQQKQFSDALTLTKQVKRKVYNSVVWKLGGSTDSTLGVSRGQNRSLDHGLS